VWKKIIACVILSSLLIIGGFAGGIATSRNILGLDIFSGSIADYRRDTEQSRLDLESARQYSDALGRGIDYATSRVDSGSSRLESGLAGVGKLASYQTQTRSLIAELRIYLATVRETIKVLQNLVDRGSTTTGDIVPVPAIP
jgi:hypothetical protein